MSGKGGWFAVFQLCALFSLAYAEDFYKLLGISRKATNKEIKKSYRQKSLEFHPDKNKSEGAADKFAQINRAYEALMNEETRSIYDQHGEEGLKRHEDGGRGGGGGGFDPFEAFFGNGFGGRQRREQEQTTPNVDIPLQLTLEEMYKGVVLEVTYIRQVLCLKWEMCMKTNQACQGPGISVQRQQIAPGFVQQVQARDDRCVARGKMWLDNCSDCKSQTEAEKIELTIDAFKGIRDGEAITFEDVADEKPGYKPGDLNFVMVEKDHSEYHREGDNLYKSMSIPLVDALVSTFPLVLVLPLSSPSSFCIIEINLTHIRFFYAINIFPFFFFFFIYNLQTGFSLTLKQLDGEEFSVTIDDVSFE